jgi:hypothetical protein
MVCNVQCERGAEVNEAASLAGNESRDASSTIASAHSHQSAVRRARRSCQNNRTPAQSTPATASLSQWFAEPSESCIESAITPYVLAHAPGITRVSLTVRLIACRSVSSNKHLRRPTSTTGRCSGDRPRRTEPPRRFGERHTNSVG